MARVKRGNVARKRRNKILRLARGFRGGNGTQFRTANQRVMKRFAMPTATAVVASATSVGCGLHASMLQLASMA
jgi:hypothetical protein